MNPKERKMNRNIALTKTMILFTILFAILPSISTAQNIDKRIKTKKQVVAEGKRDLPRISVEQLMDKMNHKTSFILLDVRTERERNAGYISGSIWLPRGVLGFKIQSICKNADTEIVVYCRKGGRSALAVKTLKQLGYTHVFNLDGGVNAWGERGCSLYNWHGEIKVVHFDKKDPYLSTYDIFKE